MLNLENTIERFKDIIAQKDDELLKEELENIHFADIAEIFDELEENYEWEKKNRCWYEDNCKQLQREKKELEKQLDEITRERIELKNEIEKFRKLIGRLYYFKDNS